MSKIYWAAPLHDAEDRVRNDKYVAMLRKDGHQVYVPHEHGVWEEVLSQFGGDAGKVRRHFYELDLKAMRAADVCIACAGDHEHPRGPSEGMLWEMGYMSADNKTVILFNENSYWDYNLMPEFGSIVFKEFDEVLNFLKDEEFK